MVEKIPNAKDGEDPSRLFSKMNIWMSEQSGFHVPGHSGLDYFSDDDCKYLIRTDTTELSSTDDFLSPQNQIKDALVEIAEIFNSAQSFFISSGSTTAIRVMLASIMNKNTHILLSRQVHLSVLTVISLLGCEYSFIETDTDDVAITARLWSQPSPEEILRALDRKPSITDILITSPNYYGDCVQIDAIAKIVHARGCRLLVDEAHGAHLYFLDSRTSNLQTALSAGADICVQSVHKTLPALTMASLLHISKESVYKNRVSPDRVRYMLRLLETSSPSFVIGASNYMAIKRMHQKDDQFFSNVAHHVCVLAHRLRKIEGLDIFAADHFHLCDPFRMTVSFSKIKYSAVSVLKALERKGIFAEYADIQSIIFIFSPFQKQRDYELLYLAIVDIFEQPEKHSVIKSEDLETSIELFKKAYQHKPLRDMHVREAMWKGIQTENILYKSACGRLNANVIMLCPPGIPLLWPGEKIDQFYIDTIKNALLFGLEVSGVNNNEICVLKS